MASEIRWNKPINGKKEKKNHTTPIFWFGLIIFGLLAFCLCFIYIIFKSDTEEKEDSLVTKKEPKINSFENVRTNKLTSVTHEEKPINLVKTWDGKMVEWPPKDAYKDEQGVWRHPGGQMCFDPRVKPHYIGTKTKQIFKSVSENQIASLLMAQPGQQFFGTMTLYKSKKFKEDFVNALITPTEINEDDSDFDKTLKKAVRDTMKELAERIKDGEDLAEILTEARQELQRLGQYKQNLLSELKSIMKGQSLTDDEVKSYVQAANKMLEDKGIAPLSVSDIAIRNLRHNVEMMALREKK